jgi:hypothetical protein
MSWYFNEIEVTGDTIPDGVMGFIYKIIHIPTKKYYIGKKSLTSTRKVKIGKREIREIKEQRKLDGISGRLPVKKIVKSDSDWKNYYSSSTWIKEQVKMGNEGDFKREIIQFCNSKKSLSYWEVYWQFKYNVLDDETSLNDNIGGRYYRKDLI